MNNSSRNESPDVMSSELQESCDIFSLIISGVFIVLCCAVCCIGNTLSLATFCHSRRMSPTIVLLQALAVVDIILLIPALFVSAVPKLCQHTGSCQWYTDVLRAYLVAYTWPITTIAHVGTIWLTVLVTVHRYLAVCKPLVKFTSKFDQIRGAYVQVCAVMVGSLVYNIPRFFEYEPNCTINKKNQTICTYVYTTMFMNTYYQLIYRNISFFVLMNVIPLSVLSVLTYKLIRELQRASSTRQQMVATNPLLDRDKALTRTLLVVVIVFLFCQTPAAITRLLGFIMDKHTRYECGQFLFFFPSISNLLVFINSSVNFFIYCFCSKSFRVNLTKLVCCRKTDVSVVYYSDARGSSHLSRRNQKDSACEEVHIQSAHVCCICLVTRENGRWDCNEFEEQSKDAEPHILSHNVVRNLLHRL